MNTEKEVQNEFESRVIDYTARSRREKSRHYSRVNNFSNGKW